MNSTPTTTSPTTTSPTTTTTSTSILQQLLSTPSTSTSTAPAPLTPTMDLTTTTSSDDIDMELVLQQLFSTSSAALPPPVDVVPEPEVVDLAADLATTSSDECDEDIVRLSTAHPNFHDPALHDQVIAELCSNTLPTSDALPLSPPIPLSSLSSLQPLLSPPVLPSSPPSPPASPSPSLPVRRRNVHRLVVDRLYKVRNWDRTPSHRNFYIYNQENTEIYHIRLPLSTRPSRSQRLHHLFESSIYMKKSKLNDKFRITFHP